MEKIYTVREVADYLQITEKAVRDYISAGELIASKLGRIWRIAESDIINFLEGFKHSKMRSYDNEKYNNELFNGWTNEATRSLHYILVNNAHIEDAPVHKATAIILEPRDIYLSIKKLRKYVEEEVLASRIIDIKSRWFDVFIYPALHTALEVIDWKKVVEGLYYHYLTGTIWGDFPKDSVGLMQKAIKEKNMRLEDVQC